MGNEWDATKNFVVEHLLNPKGDLVRMQVIKKEGNKKKEKISLEIIFATEMGLLNTIKRVKINLNPSKKTQNIFNPKQTQLVDFHMQISKKIDEIIQKNEKENKTEQKIVEPRTTWTKKPQTPMFKTEITTDEKTTNLDDELFELEIPTTNINTQNLNAEQNLIKNQPVFVGPIQQKNTTTLFTVGDHSEDKILTSMGRVKINKEKIRNKKIKNSTKGKNEYSKAKNNYQKLQTELEKKKQEIEEIQKLTRQKEEELKKKEKQKAIEQKKKEKEGKIKAKQELQLKKQKEKEMKKQEKLRQIEQIKLEKQKQKELKQKELEKQIKQIEEEKIKAKQELQLKKQKTPKKEIKIRKDILFKSKEKKNIKPKIEKNQKQPETSIQPPEDDLIKAFEIIDDLLGKLPDDTIDEFAKSDDFEIYKKVVSMYKKK
jgi:hypothetical protein